MAAGLKEHRLGKGRQRNKGMGIVKRVESVMKVGIYCDGWNGMVAGLKEQRLV